MKKRSILTHVLLFLFMLLGSPLGIAQAESTVNVPAPESPHQAAPESGASVNPTAFVFLENEVWVALGSPAGILHLDLNTGELLDHFTVGDGNVAAPTTAALGAFDALYFTTLEGVLVVHEGEPLALLREDPLGNRATRAIVVDAEGRMWVTTEQGIAVWLEDGWLPVPPEDAGWRDPYGYPGDVVTSVAIDPAGRAWIAIWDVGVAVFDGDAWTTYTIEDGLPTAEIYALAADEMGNIWLATAHGLVQGEAETGAWTVVADAQSLIQPDLRGILPVGGSLWLWDADGAALRVDNPGQSDQRIRRFTDELAGEGQTVQVTGLGVDPSGWVWFAHADGHLSAYTGEAFVNVPEVSSYVPTKPEATRRYTSEQYGFVLEYPESWAVEEKEEDGQVSFEAADEPVFSLVQPMKLGDAGELLGLEMTAELFFKGLAQKMPDMQVTETFTRTVDGMPAEIRGLQFTEPQSGLKMDGYVAITLKNGIGYALLAMTQRGDAERALRMLDQLLDGFRFSGEPEPPPTAEYVDFTSEDGRISVAYPADWELYTEDVGLLLFSPSEEALEWYLVLRQDLEQPATVEDVAAAIDGVIAEAAEVNDQIVLWRRVGEDALYVELLDTSVRYRRPMLSVLLGYPLDQSVVILGLGLAVDEWPELSLSYRDLFGRVRVDDQPPPVDTLFAAGTRLYTYHGIVSFHYPPGWQIEDRADDRLFGPGRPNFLLIAGPMLPAGPAFEPMAGSLLVAEGQLRSTDDTSLADYLLARLEELYGIAPTDAGEPTELSDGGVFLGLDDVEIAGEPGHRLDVWAYQSDDYRLFIGLSALADVWQETVGAVADTLYIDMDQLARVMDPEAADLMIDPPAATATMTTTQASAMAWYSDTVWLALPPDRGIAGWRVSDTAFLGYTQPAMKIPGRIEVTTLATNGGDLLWAGGPDGLHVWDGLTWASDPRPMTPFVFDELGRAWAVVGRRIWRWDGWGWQLIGRLPEGAKVNDMALQVGRQVAWLATDSGVAYVTPNGGAWVKDLPPSYAPAHAIAVDRRGWVWVATAGGVARWDGSTWRTYDIGEGPRAEPVSIAVGARGHVWVGYGTAEAAPGVDEFNGLRWIPHNAGELSRVGIGEITPGADDALWMVVRDEASRVTPAGLYRFDGQSWAFYPLP